MTDSDERNEVYVSRRKLDETIILPDKIRCVAAAVVAAAVVAAAVVAAARP